MKMKRKLLAGIGAAMMVVSACAVSASAATLTAQLYAGETVKYSAKCKGYGGGRLWGGNNSQSAFAVRVLGKHQYAGIWTQDCALLLNPGASNAINARKYATQHTWQLGLNPEGGNKYGCMAQGELTVY